MEDRASDGRADKDEYDIARASKFHFKTGPSRRHREKHDEDHVERHSSKRHQTDKDRESRRRHKESKRKRRHGTSNPHRSYTRTGDYENPGHRHRESLYDGLEEEGAGLPDTNPDEAFRESLFDALADDEGAAYWEGVYGQPINVYPNTKQGPDGKLERMSDEEYAEYVRMKMWEKSHQHIIEEREARERARKKRRTENERLEEEAAQQWEEREDVRRKMEESLRRGEERRKVREAAQAWDHYVWKWDELKARQHLDQEDGSKIRYLIPWPVISGKWSHVTKEEIECFLTHSSAWKEDAPAMLKAERVRWHPDKMQQRFSNRIDPEVMKTVTSIFQVIDSLWNEHRK